MKITNDLIEGDDISLPGKKRLILVSSSAALEDLLHVICVYTESQHLSLDKGVIHVRGTEGVYKHESESFLSYNMYYDISSKESTFIMLGNDSQKFGEFSISLLKIKGMQETHNGP